MKDEIMEIYDERIKDYLERLKCTATTDISKELVEILEPLQRAQYERSVMADNARAASTSDARAAAYASAKRTVEGCIAEAGGMTTQGLIDALRRAMAMEGW